MVDSVKPDPNIPGVYLCEYRQENIMGVMVVEFYFKWTGTKWVGGAASAVTVAGTAETSFTFSKDIISCIGPVIPSFAPESTGWGGIQKVNKEQTFKRIINA
jgi:hypothetical protein